MRVSRSRRRWRLAGLVTILAMVVAGLAVAPPHQPAMADPVANEAQRSDVSLEITELGGGYDDHQGWSDTGAAYFNDDDGPDCALGTGRSPTNGDGDAPSNVGIAELGFTDDRNSLRHRASFTNPAGSHEITDDNQKYWLHAAKDDPNDDDTICLRTEVTTDSTGYFSVTFPRTLSGTPAFVIWKASDPANGGHINYPRGQYVVSKSSTGFTGRAMKHDSALNTVTLGIDYWASVSTSVDVDEGAGSSTYYNGYHHRGAQTTVTTDSSGNATVNYTDFTDGDPTSMQASPCDYTGVGSPTRWPRIIVNSISASGAEIYVHSYAGSAITSQTICLNYVAVGDRGGSDRPIITPEGDAWQIYEERDLINNPEDFTPCGTEHPCIRWPEWTSGLTVRPGRTYRYTTFFLEWEAIEGAEPETYVDPAFEEWEDADAHTPAWTKITSGTPEVWVEAGVLNPARCAQTTVDYGNTPEDGFNTILSSEITFNSGNDIDWSNVANVQVGDECVIDSVAPHEVGHVLGLAHSDTDGAAQMDTAGAAPFTAGITPTDELIAAAIYGDSTSNMDRIDLKTSHFAEPANGQVAQAVVTVGDSKAVQGPRNHVVTEVELTATDTWQGKVPAKAWLYGGELGDKGTTSWPVPVTSLTPGSRWLVQVDTDGQIISALYIEDAMVLLDSQVKTDDIDGGDKSRAGLNGFKKAAKDG